MGKPLVHSEVLARLQALGLKPEHQAYVLKRLKLAVPDAPGPDFPQDGSAVAGSAVDGSAVDGFALATGGEPRPPQAPATQLPTVQVVVEQAPRAASAGGPAQPPQIFPSESVPQPPLPPEPDAVRTPADTEQAQPPDDGQPPAAPDARILQQAAVAQATVAQALAARTLQAAQQARQQAALENARRQLQQARLEAQTHPLREWRSGARVMAAIAVATGGLGTALAESGRNAALDTIENGIEGEFGTHPALRAAYLEQVRQQVLATAERTPAALHRANGQALAADLEQAAQQARDALVQAGPHPAAAQLPSPAGGRGFRVGRVSQSPTDTAPSEAAGDSGRAAAVARGLRQSLDELIRLGSQGRAAPGSPRAKSIGQLTRTVLEQYRTLRGQGVFDGSDAELARTRVTEPVRFAALNLKGDVAAARRLRTVLDRTLGETGQGFHP